MVDKLSFLVGCLLGALVLWRVLPGVRNHPRSGPSVGAGEAACSPEETVRRPVRRQDKTA